MPQALKPLCLTQVGRIPFSHFHPSSLLGNKNWAPQYKDVEVGKFRQQNWLNRLQMVQFECPRYRNHLAFLASFKLTSQKPQIVPLIRPLRCRIPIQRRRHFGPRSEEVPPLRLPTRLRPRVRGRRRLTRVLGTATLGRGLRSAQRFQMKV